MPKVRISSWSEAGTSHPYRHLQPLAAALVGGGNSYRISEGWGSDREGYVCWLEKPIDFALVGENFELPETVVAGPAADLICCRESGARIQGANYASEMRPNNSSKPTPLRGAA